MQQTSQILDVAIGLASLYLLLSLICSSLTESIEKWWMKKRPQHLSEGLLELFGSGSEGLTFLKDFYNHPLIFGLFKGTATLDDNNRLKSVGSNASLPSYIDAHLFSKALIDQILAGKALDVANLQAQIASNAVLPEKLKISLQSLITSAGSDVNQAVANIENWYGAMTNRVSGWYKRHTQLVAFCMAATLTILGNFDSIAIGKSLMLNEALRNQLVASAMAITPANSTAAGSTPTQCAGDASSDKCQQWLNNQLMTMQNLGMPVGWQNANFPNAPAAVFEKLLGWLMTMIAVSLGAPFWFDLLNKFVNIRSTLKPTSSGNAKSETQPSEGKKPSAAG